MPPYRWQALGSLPAGLTLSSSGIVSGRPDPANGANTGSYTVAVQITDQEGVRLIRNITFEINVGDCKPLAVNQASISALEGQELFFGITANDGTPPYRWRKVAGPDTVNVSADGVLTGSIATEGTYTVVVEVTDAIGTTVRANVSIAIKKPQ